MWALENRSAILGVLKYLFPYCLEVAVIVLVDDGRLWISCTVREIKVSAFRIFFSSHDLARSRLDISRWNEDDAIWNVLQISRTNEANRNFRLSRPAP